MNVKLTDSDNRTQNKTVWGENVRHEAENQTGKMELCTKTCIHYYLDPVLAVMMNPAHGNFTNPVGWEFKPEGRIITDGTKSGCRAGTTIKKIKLPTVNRTQKVAFGILCALAAYEDKGFRKWAKNWLNGTDRTAKSAYAAAYAYADAAYAAVYAAYAVSCAGRKTNFVKLAHKAMHVASIDVRL